jgi:hypothetical protein
MSKTHGGASTTGQQAWVGFAVVLLVAAFAWTPRAEAIGFQFGGLFKGGGGSPGIINDADLDAMEEPSTGFGFGLQGYFLFSLNSFLSIGPNIDYTYLDTEGRYGEYSWHMPSVGLMMRLHTDAFVLGGWLNYMFASLDVNYDQNAINRTDASYNVGGVHFGVNPALRIKIHPYRTYLELGGFVSYSFLILNDLPYTLRGTNTPSVRDIEYGVWQYGVSLGLSFDVGGRTGGAAVHRQYGQMFEDLYQ